MDDRRTAIGLRLPIVVSGRGLSGTQAGEYGVSTVSKVSVKTGNSITIPCRYNLRYIEYVKYWCQGDYWNSCSALVRTDQPKISGTVSISDDVTRRIFSVTMTDLQPEDSGYYWCAVETTGRDQHTYLHLSVTTGTPGLYVDQQEVTGVEGGSVTVCCHHSNTVAKKWLWCKMGIYYVPLVGRYSGLLDGTSVTSQQTIDNNNRHILTVTLNGLNMGDTGWYWCSTGDLQMPVHITVNQLTTTQTVRYVSVQTGGSITIPCHYDLNHINHVKYWCKGLGWEMCSYVVRTDHPKSSSNASISDDINKRIFTMTMTNLKSRDSENYRCIVEINGGPDIRIQWFYLSVTPVFQR
ncbi:polymeric immunoglobulin receptor-like [Coregonus clupeaformis]|uniref:polymeric immunoglobulin receptor-like n=1 Tax=Coregonus clupeaformis TaxID=59861 RepID=UPI001E1C27A9|nr:polymeric immunoglobulin receptor-like [Coregonus clupeaformis]